MTYIIDPYRFGGGGVVTLSGEFIEHIPVIGLALAGVKANSDGTMQQRKGGLFTQIDASTDWIIPNGAASSLYEVRYTNVSGNFGSFTPAAAVDTWIDLGADRQWLLTNGTAIYASRTFTLEIRYNGGAVLSSASYTIAAQVSTN